MAKQPGAEKAALDQWAQTQVDLVTSKLDEFLAPPVSAANKDNVLRGIQNWIIRERRKIAQEAEN
jgi:hypothetical protein